MSVAMAVDLAGIKLKNPIVGASGTFGYGLLYDGFYPVEKLGGFCSKGLSLKPKAGNPTPRICETPAGMLNAIGLQNIGLEKFVEKKMPKLRLRDTAVIVNFFGNTVEEYAALAGRLDAVDGVHGLEMNISCPNVKEGGIAFGSDLSLTRRVVAACRKETRLPLIVKLSPNVTDITAYAKVCEEEGADGVSVINTLLGMAIDIDAKKPVLANVTGGLSGPAIKPVALRMVWQCYKAVSIPIFGLGGIASATDVVEFLMAGATAVQVGTHNFVEPEVAGRLADDVASILADRGYGSVTDVVGAAHR